MAPCADLVGSHIWSVVPAHIQEELHPLLSSILSRNLSERERDGLIAYCVLYHPHVTLTGPRKVLEKAVTDAMTGAARARNRNAAANGLGLMSRSPLNRDALAHAVCELGAESELLKLLGDRGPDFGLSLLILLELLFQVAFCLRRQRESNTEALTAMSYCSRLLEIVALHLDAPPIWPRFCIKFGMTLTGLVYHRKLQSVAAARIFQLNYFILPPLRKYLLFPADEEEPRSKALSRTYTHTLLDPRVEETLWSLVRGLALEAPSEATCRRVARGKRPERIECRTDAMAIVFERLHHLARELFGAQLFLYGSGATGFATVNSDIDVVVQSSAAQNEALVEEAKAARAASKPDLNVFPALQNCGLAGTYQSGVSVGAQSAYPLVGDWSWLDDKPPQTAAAIWLNRKFAWACYRLYGWSVQCVQSAYVPIVKILAAVDTETALPCELPLIFVADYPYGSTLISLLRQVELEAKPAGEGFADSLENMLLLLAVSRRMSLARVKKYVARTVAYEVLSEAQYASWPPALASKARPADAQAYIAATSASADPDGRLARIEDLFVTLFHVYWRNLRSRNSPFPSPRSQSPALHPPKAPPLIADGMLSALDGAAAHDFYLVEADISVGRQVGIHNSRLLRAYAQVDPRVIALGLLIKQWARACGVEDAYNGYLSGYQWTLIVIHFLQHYCSLPVPSHLESRGEWRALVSTFRHARCGFAPTHLPLVPNLQHQPLGPFPRLSKRGPLPIYEIEGELDVWFYEPHLGNNEPVETGASWPENTLLPLNPLAYAYALLQAPYDLKAIAADFAAEAPPGALPPADVHQTLARVLANHRPKDREADAAVWLMRLHSCPRPHSDAAATDEDGTPINNSAARTLTPHLLWDVQRIKLSERMARTWDDTRRETERAPYPPLTQLRDTTFIQQHVMDRADTLMETFRKAQGEPTLAELLFEFFEYFGTRLNYATDMIDTARTPELPRGKKEWFKTSIFDPRADDSSTTPQKEVTGRGNGPFQYRGRHFLCLRDPMEKLRTVGPPYRCQTQITKAFTGSISVLSDINRMTDRKAVTASLKDLFTKTPGSVPAALRGLRTPVRECLRDYIELHLHTFSSAMTSSETQECRAMYTGLRQMITENGRYQNLSAPPAAGEKPFGQQPQIGTRGAIAVPPYRRHSVTSVAAAAPHERRGGSLPKTAPGENPAAPPPAPAAEGGRSRARCTSLPHTAPTLMVPSSASEAETAGGNAAASEAGSSDLPASSSESGAADNQSVVERFKDSELSWCMKPAAFRRFQAYLRRPAVLAERAWRAKECDDPVKWLESSTGIKRPVAKNGRLAAPPIRAIRSRPAEPPAG